MRHDPEELSSMIEDAEQRIRHLTTELDESRRAESEELVASELEEARRRLGELRELQTEGSPTSGRLHAEHTPDEVRARLDRGPDASYLRDFVYGAIDGTVTTFAVVAGVVGAGLRPVIVIILGVANLLADGFSMAASNVLATRSDLQRREAARTQEQQHIALIPEGEREEVRQIYAGKGFTGEDLERIVEVITSDRELWVETMLREEHGFAERAERPWRAGASTFVAFVVVGTIPLLSFASDLVWPGTVERAFTVSAVLTAFAFFGVGALKSRFVEQAWWRAGSETLALGGAAAVVAYVIGSLLSSLAR